MDKETRPIIGTERTVKRFLFLPKKLGKEIKWFTTATINQRYVPNFDGKRIKFQWKDTHFL